MNTSCFLDNLSVCMRVLGWHESSSMIVSVGDFF
jgi:hypothetical protein